MNEDKKKLISLSLDDFSNLEFSSSFLAEKIDEFDWITSKYLNLKTDILEF